MGNTIAGGQVSTDCTRHFKAIQDTQYILNGKWRVLIIAVLGSGSRRYLELQRLLDGIGSKMLSKELRHLEINGLISRKVLPSKPISVEYALTEYGRTLKPIMDEMAQWGMDHKERIQQEMKRY